MSKTIFSRQAYIVYSVIITCFFIVSSCMEKEDGVSQRVVLKACGTCGTFPVCCVAGSDPDGDGWGWENNASCVVNGSAAQKQQCSGGVTASCTGTAINPFTQINGGTWQNVATAALAAGGTVSFGPQPSTGGSWKWTGPNGFTSAVRQITISNVQTVNAGNYVATYTNASNCPSTATFTVTMSGSGTTGGGFTISGTQLKDANGNNFIMKGFAIPTAWFASDVNANIANIRTRTGANCLRIVVTTSTADASWQASVNSCIANKMIPMVELHDVTCGTTASGVQSMATWWASKKSFLTQPAIAKYILINIANEWGDWNMATNSPTTWRDAYISAISTIRNAGINTTLVIDAPGCGQDVQHARTIKTYGTTVFNSDPKKNCLFSLHLYCEWSTSGGSSISADLPALKNAGIPIMVGEYGFQEDNGSGGVCDINESQVISTCQANGIGWLAWSWKGNGSPVQYLDLSTDWGGTSLSSWGNTVINGSNGTKTAATASVFN